MTDHTAIIAILERRLEERSLELRESAKLIAKLRREVEGLEQALSASVEAVLRLQAREHAYEGVLDVLRPMAEQAGWDHIVRAIDDLKRDDKEVN